MWLLSDSHAPVALSIVDGLGAFTEYGPHYSRRTPGSDSFTGIGQEVVLVSVDYAAVWSVVRQRTPPARGSGASRGRIGESDARPRFVWRNNVFRRMPTCGFRASELVKAATQRTYEEWVIRYGRTPDERLRTEIDPSKVRSTNPGCCYLKAGWERGKVVNGKLFLFAPPSTVEPKQMELIA